MKKLLSFLAILVFGVISSACVNTFAVHELNETAVKLTQEGNYKDAISRLENAIELDQNVYETRYNLAIAYMGMDEFEKALTQIEKAQELSKEKIADVFYTKAVILSSLADSLFKTKDDENNEIEVTFANENEKIEAQNKYIEYLTLSNKNYEKYLQMNGSAKDANEVKESIVSNNELIEKIKNPQDE